MHCALSRLSIDLTRADFHYRNSADWHMHWVHALGSFYTLSLLLCVFVVSQLVNLTSSNIAYSSVSKLGAIIFVLGKSLKNTAELRYIDYAYYLVHTLYYCLAHCWIFYMCTGSIIRMIVCTLKRQINSFSNGELYCIYWTVYKPVTEESFSISVNVTQHLFHEVGWLDCRKKLFWPLLKTFFSRAWKKLFQLLGHISWNNCQNIMKF